MKIHINTSTILKSTYTPIQMKYEILEILD